MGNPGLVAVDPVDAAVSYGARLERGEVGPDIGLGEHRRRQDFTGGDLRQPFALLFLGTGADDQLGRDLGAGAERSHADIAARELLGNDAHRFLAEREAAMLRRDRETEHAQLRHLRKHVERNVTVGKMPFLRLRHDFAVGELAHLLADRREHAIEPAVTDSGVVVSSASTPPGERAARRCRKRARLSSGPAMRAATAATERPTSAGRTISPWLIGMPPCDLGEIFADPDFDQQLLHLAETADLHACARHRLRAGAPPPHRWRATQDRGWRAARARTDRPPSGLRP